MDVHYDGFKIEMLVSWYYFTFVYFDLDSVLGGMCPSLMK